ncbi:integrase [Fructobacillus ficulneus]|uniref:Integrase n=2 Tax=Fructobacillus ficulneus TaxID=157463 RepID=A0A0K8MI85_9LACO|nr:integrase [Fructobacillus ficulneus]
MGEVGETFTSLSGKSKEDFGHGDAKFIPYINVYSNPITDINKLDNIEIDPKQNEVKYGDVFFTTSSETPSEVGMSSVWLGNSANIYLNSFCFGYRPTEKFDLYYLAFMFRSPIVRGKFILLAQGISRYNISKKKAMEIEVPIPIIEEQRKVGALLRHLDNLITLHQRGLKYFKKGGFLMLNNLESDELFHVYYKRWINLYKEGAIRSVTMSKYWMTHKWLIKIAPKLTLGALNRLTYQQLLNEYAIDHERQTTMDFHHQLKGAILDAVDEGLVERDPTRKAIIKGKTPRVKKPKYLNQFELHTLITQLDLSEDINWDWFILLVAKTGMRFSEALALTPDDFDFSHQMLSVNKTWDYKGKGGFLPTKNKSSVRKIQMDWQTVIQFSELVKGVPEEQPIFVNINQKIYNSTVNARLAKLCAKSEIPTISIHGLRHTHASLLLFAGVSIASVARRLGHASMTTTQKTYLHIIQELENQDVDLVMRSLSGLS